MKSLISAETVLLDWPREFTSGGSVRKTAVGSLLKFAAQKETVAVKRLSLPFARDLARRGAFGLLDILSARTIQFRLDVVVDPFFVPPLDREHR